MEETSTNSSKEKADFRGRREQRSIREASNDDKSEAELPEITQFPEVIASLAETPENIEILYRMVKEYHYTLGLEELLPFFEFAIQNSATESEELLHKIKSIARHTIDSRDNNVTESIFGSEEFIQSLLAAFPESPVIVSIFEDILYDLRYIDNVQFCVAAMNYLLQNGILDKIGACENIKVISHFISYVFETMRSINKGTEKYFDVNILAPFFQRILDTAMAAAPEEEELANYLLYDVCTCISFPEFAIAFMKHPQLQEFFEKFPPAMVLPRLNDIIREMFRIGSDREYFELSVDRKCKFIHTEDIKICKMLKIEETPIPGYLMEMLKSDDEELLYYTMHALGELGRFKVVVDAIESNGLFEGLMAKYEDGSDFKSKNVVFIFLCKLFLDGTNEQARHLIELGLFDLISSLFEQQANDEGLRLIMSVCNNAIKISEETGDPSFSELVFDNGEIMEMLERIRDGEFDSFDLVEQGVTLSMEADALIIREPEQ